MVHNTGELTVLAIYRPVYVCSLMEMNQQFSSAFTYVRTNLIGQNLFALNAVLIAQTALVCQLYVDGVR